MEQAKSERDNVTRQFFGIGWDGRKAKDNLVKFSDSQTITPAVIKQSLRQQRVPPVMNFAERWKIDEGYQKLAKKCLLKIIRNDVRALILHSAFGSLWHVFCNDNHPRR